jgi:hypothetical protein
MICATWEFDARKKIRVRPILNVEKKPICHFKLVTGYLPDPLSKIQ